MRSSSVCDYLAAAVSFEVVLAQATTVAVGRLPSASTQTSVISLEHLHGIVLRLIAARLIERVVSDRELSSVAVDPSRAHAAIAQVPKASITVPRAYGS